MTMMATLCVGWVFEAFCEELRSDFPKPLTLLSMSSECFCRPEERWQQRDRWSKFLLLFVCSGLIADRPVFCICATGKDVQSVVQYFKIKTECNVKVSCIILKWTIFYDDHLKCISHLYSYLTNRLIHVLTRKTYFSKCQLVYFKREEHFISHYEALKNIKIFGQHRNHFIQV